MNLLNKNQFPKEIFMGIDVPADVNENGTYDPENNCLNYAEFIDDLIGTESSARVGRYVLAETIVVTSKVIVTQTKDKNNKK